MHPTLPEMKARYSIGQAWKDLGLDGEPAKICRSPFPSDHKHGDAHPSFSVFAEGTRWKNQATGEGGDVLDLVRKARGLDFAGALAFVRERLGTGSSTTSMNAGSSSLPELRAGTSAELAQLGRVRELRTEGLKLAMDHSFLHFGRLWGRDFWAVTDQRRKLVEFRRLDGKPWPAYGRLAERKSHCLGTGKNWPVGTLESVPYRQVAWVEGAPDFLAFWHFAWLEGKVETIAPVGVLGAANRRISSDALAQFRGKSVTLYPHADTAGRDAAKAWARQLRSAGAAVIAFDLSGIQKDDGTQGKDLNDLCWLSPDCFESADGARFHEVLP